MLYQFWALVTVAILIWLGFRTRRFTKYIETLQDVKPQQGPWPKISFIVAACNEEKTLRYAAESLLQINYPALELILINDRSTDDTGRVIDDLAMHDSRIKAVHIDHLPAGWLGKVHALHKGVETTKGEWILFADADIHFATNTLRKAITYCQVNNIDFLTAVPEVRSGSPFLLTVMAQLFHQGSLLLDPRRLNDPKRRTCCGIGAFMLFRREIYNRSNKLEWLRMEAIDDGGLALMLRKAGARMGMLLGLDEIHLEWYPNVMAYVKGVEKNAFAICQYSWAYLSGLCAVNWLFALGLFLAPWFFCGWFIQTLTVAALIFYFVSACQQMNKMMRLPFFLVLLFPFAAALLPFVYLRAAMLATFRGGIKWRGTFYSLEDLKKNQRMKLGELMFNADASTPSNAASSALRTPIATNFTSTSQPQKYVCGYRIANDAPSSPPRFPQTHL